MRRGAVEDLIRLAYAHHEHILSMLSPLKISYLDKPLARHSNEHHVGRPFTVTVHIEKQTRGTLDRKLVEATLIKLRKPQINGKTEMLVSLQLLPEITI